MRLKDRRGSSPLARGLLQVWEYLFPRRRIIPARAGFTPVTRVDDAIVGDHPRSRGVYIRKEDQNEHRPGSSPLARGLPYHLSATRNFRRIIPARAGFTVGNGGGESTRADHPRSRGVYGRMVCSASHFGGSSPLARGLLRPKAAGLIVGGIIPARAGFTSARARVELSPSDHPRSRGVYHAPSSRASDFAGSSPLARGLLYMVNDSL